MARKRTYQSRHDRLTVGKVLVMLLLLFGAVIIMIPLLWTFSMALKPDSEVYKQNFFPSRPEFSNFYTAVTAIPFVQYLFNTLKILVPNVIGTVSSATVVAYGFSRFEFKGKKIWFLLLLSTMMLPGQITMIPQFLMFRAMGWVNTFLPLVIPAFFGSAFNIFLIRQFMSGIPKDFDEAAYIDGAGQLTIFAKIIVPMSKPAMTAVTVFTFMGVWNDFNGPLIYLNESHRFTLALGLSFFKGLYTSSWNLLMAATCIVMIPVLVIFFIAQDYIINGISISSGTKG